MFRGTGRDFCLRASFSIGWLGAYAKTASERWLFLICASEARRSRRKTACKITDYRLILIIILLDFSSLSGGAANASAASMNVLGGPAAWFYKRRDLSSWRRFQSCFGRAKMTQMGKLL
jgi:hypothetical protein